MRQRIDLSEAPQLIVAKVLHERRHCQARRSSSRQASYQLRQQQRPALLIFRKRILCGQDYHAAHPEFEVFGASSDSQTNLSIHMAVPADLSIVKPPGFTDPPRMIRQYAVHQLYPDTYDTYIYNLS